MGAVKLSVDGGLPARLHGRWSRIPGSRPTWAPEHLGAISTRPQGGDDEGWQCGYHAIGDAAIQLAVDVFARVLDESRPDHRHYLDHFVCSAAETLEKTAHYGILISAAELHMVPTLRAATSRIRREKLEEQLSEDAHQSGISSPSGATTIHRTDAGLYGATTRRGARAACTRGRTPHHGRGHHRIHAQQREHHREEGLRNHRARTPRRSGGAVRKLWRSRRRTSWGPRSSSPFSAGRSFREREGES